MAKFIADIEHIERKLQAKREITVLDKLHVYQWLNRDARRYLSSSQFLAFSYIIDRTVGWGRNKFRASNGNVVSGTGDYSGVGLSERTYYRVLNDLVELGLIERCRLRDSVMITVHVRMPTTAVEPFTEHDSNVVSMR
jgi:hypothetical protein